MFDGAALTESDEFIRGAGLVDLPEPHNLALSLSCADVPPPALGGGEGSVGGRPPIEL